MRVKTVHILYVLFVPFVLFGLAVTQCQTPTKPAVKFAQVETARNDNLHSRQGESLRFAVAAVNSPLLTLGLYEGLFKYLEKELGKPVEFVQRKTYADINQLLRNGEVDIAIICTGAYVAAKEEFGLEAIAMPVVNGATVYYSYVIVRKDSPVGSFAGLRGKTYAFTDPLSNSGRLVPLYQLALMNETPARFFSRYIFTYSHDNSIKAVSKKLVDGASVDSLVLDGLVKLGNEEAQSVRILEKSPPYGINPVVVSPLLSPSLKYRIKDLMLNMHLDPSAAETLAKLNFDRFSSFREGAYDRVREMRAVVSRVMAP